MTWPDKDSPFWPLARQVVVGSVVLIAVTFWYASGFVADKDLPVLLTILSSLFGFDVVKHFVAKEK